MPKLKRVMRRLRSRAGESLTEVLVALLVSALGLMLLAGMINASSNMVIRSKDVISSYVGAETSMIEKQVGGETESITFKKTGESGQKLTNSWSDSTSTVNLYSNSVTLHNTTVELY